MKRRVLQVVGRNIRDAELNVIDCIRRHAFVVWISVRAHSRVLSNETQALSDLASRLLQLGDDIAIVLDGFSYPTDMEANAAYSSARQTFLDRGERTRLAADQLIEASTLKHNGAEARMYNLAGVRLPLSLAAAQLCSFYVSHHGTQQHKIGWFCNVPGIVHANRTVLKSLPAKWVQDQSQGSVRPVYVSEADVEDVDDPSSPLGFYVWNNVDMAVELCSQSLRSKEK
jgi:hypothetical protein